MIGRALMLGLLAGVVGCGGSGAQGGAGGTATTSSGGGHDGGGSCLPGQPGCLDLSHAFDPETVTPGQETVGICQSWTLNNPEELWVNSVELDNDGAYHHSNWFFVPNTKFMQPDGAWDCSAGGFDEVVAALQGGVLYAQSTQAKQEVQKFPDGVAVRVPPYSRIIGSTHLLNASGDALTTTLRMKIKAIPKDEAKVKLVPFRLSYHDLHIPPQSSAEFSASCDLKTPTEASGVTWGMTLYYVLPHYHKRGQSFHLRYSGGPNDGKDIDSLGGFNGEAHGKAFDPPVDVTSAGGLSFGCSFQNETTNELVYGFGDDEMCDMLGFADMKVAYDSEVRDGDGMVTGMQAGTVTNSGPCTVVVLPWDPEKKGGVAP